jgi:N-acetylneuraminic acid mutarotase
VIWTGEEMIVWGGCCSREEYGDGAAYDPLNDRWRSLPPAPIHARTAHTAVWTGEEMYVWGGHVFEREFADGAAYNPRRDRWELFPPAPIEGRYSHTAVWTGEEMLVWGGATTRPSILSDGASLGRSWTLIGESAPGRSSHSAIWTGEEMLVFGGCCGRRGNELGGGEAYNPTSDRWSPLAPVAFGARQGHSAIWSDGRMLVWGGKQGELLFLPDGYAYEPETREFSLLPTGPLTARNGHSSIWTGREMLTWGGCCDEGQRAFAGGAALAMSVEQAPLTPTRGPGEEDAGPPLRPRDADFGVGAMIALGGLLLLIALAAGARALRRRRES